MHIVNLVVKTRTQYLDFAKRTREASPSIHVFAPIAANDTRWNGDFHAIK